MTLGNQLVDMEFIRRPDGLTQVTLSGRLDTPGVDRIESRFLAAVAAEGKNAIVDVSRVAFIGSMGIRMLITAARSMGHRHARLALFGAQSMVHEVFENVSLREMIPIVDTEAEAITAVAS